MCHGVLAGAGMVRSVPVWTRPHTEQGTGRLRYDAILTSHLVDVGQRTGSRQRLFASTRTSNLRSSGQQIHMSWKIVDILLVHPAS